MPSGALHQVARYGCSDTIVDSLVSQRQAAEVLPRHGASDAEEDRERFPHYAVLVVTLHLIGHSKFPS